MPTALITGCNRGLGLEFVRQLNEQGWCLHACCRKPENAPALLEIVEASQGRVQVHPLDIGNLERISQLAQQLKDRPIDLLINNAGVYHGKGCSLGELSYEEWLESFKVNVLGSTRMAEAFLEHIKTSRHKTIALVTSKMGSVDDNTSGGSYIYRTAKAALNMVAKSLSIDLANQGIKVALLHPGWVRTDMGGSSGLIDPPESVNGMLAIIDKLTPETSGRFFAYDGKEIPW